MKDKFQVLLAKYYYVPIIISAFILFAIGGWGMVLWGVFVRVVVGWHTTWFVNSLAHIFGDNDRFETTDDSTNNWFVALADIRRRLAQQSSRFSDFRPTRFEVVSIRYELADDPHFRKARMGNKYPSFRY